MRTVAVILLLASIPLAAGCHSEREVIVIIKSPLQPVAAARSQTVLYQVIKPQEFAGKYGMDVTTLSVDEISERVGRSYRFRVHAFEKWEYKLMDNPPLAGSVSASAGYDFFRVAEEIRPSPANASGQ